MQLLQDFIWDYFQQLPSILRMPLMFGRKPYKVWA